MRHEKWLAREKNRKAEIQRREDVAKVKAVRDRFAPPPPELTWQEILIEKVKNTNHTIVGARTGRWSSRKPIMIQGDTMWEALDVE